MEKFFRGSMEDTANMYFSPVTSPAFLRLLSEAWNREETAL
ncbi:hypothetical protein [Bacteroides sp. AR20]